MLQKRAQPVQPGVPEFLVALEPVERALHRTGLDHWPRAAARRNFFRRLKQKLHSSWNALAETGQHLRGAHENGDMHVVTAGVHHSRLLSVVRRAHRRLERHVDHLRHRQRIHLGAQGDRWSGLSSLEDPDDTGNSANVLLNFDAE